MFLFLYSMRMLIDSSVGKELNAAVPAKEESLEKLKASAANVEAFIEKVKRYTDIPELTPELLRLFIERIEAGERSKDTPAQPSKTSASSTGTWALRTRWSRLKLANRDLKN